MSRATTKSELIAAAVGNYEKLTVLVSELTQEELSTPFDFTADATKKEAH
jgi:hypothetical protein